MNPLQFLEKHFDSVMNEMLRDSLLSSSRALRFVALFYFLAYYALKIIYQLSKVVLAVVVAMSLMNISQTLQNKLEFDVFVYEQAQAGIKGA